jgi:hypothetical protein
MRFPDEGGCGTITAPFVRVSPVSFVLETSSIDDVREQSYRMKSLLTAAFPLGRRSISGSLLCSQRCGLKKSLVGEVDL